MGKETGFLEFERSVPVAAAPADRIRHWDEYYEPMTDAQLADQGARCMECGVPFCHTGVLINRMAAGCPINNLIPEWNDLIYRGRSERRLHARTLAARSATEPGPTPAAKR